MPPTSSAREHDKLINFRNELGGCIYEFTYLEMVRELPIHGKPIKLQFSRLFTTFF